jgi:hypothetical protein
LRVGHAAGLDARGVGTDPRERAPRRGYWHAGAHALVALARIEPEDARPRIAAARARPAVAVRMYAARAALRAKDTTVLERSRATATTT